MAEILAHKDDDGRTQSLEEHLNNTAHLAEEFGNVFGIGKEAYLAGLFHDIGKSSAAFQRRIRGSHEQVDHSTAGAQELLKRNQMEAAFAVAGHHGGIPDGGNRIDGPDSPTLVGRSKREIEPYDLPENLTYPALTPKDYNGFQQSFYIRMLYSCLVDADFLDTEAFMQGELPRGKGAPVSELLKKVRQQANMYLTSDSSAKAQQIRNQVLRRCISVGQNEKKGLFTLTVPTGGGKTFSSLAFAAEHAAANGLSRIIYIIPYTSIIDQTAEIFKNLLGAENVLEHYASADYFLLESEEMSSQDYARILASENWDSPVIVTTAVQFFESLFSNRSSRCRKLHNIADSVLIFDEAQTLPSDYLIPCLASIAELIRQCGCSAVLCTATQPALEPLFQRIAPELTMREICPDYEDLFSELERTTLEQLGTVTLEDLSGMLSRTEQVLCVVNRRATAQELYRLLPKEGSYCLTTLLCSADRRHQLAEIRNRLKTGQVCRVISTSLIEAGVDVDFPNAYREETGLDSVLQTAGRCNREGRRAAHDSKVILFALDNVRPPSVFNQNISALHQVLRCFPEQLQSPEAIHGYFSALYSIKGNHALDKAEIMDAFERGRNGCMLPFAQVAKEFQMIDSPGKTVYIPCDEGRQLCEQLLQKKYSRTLFRKLGLYGISLYPKDYDALVFAGALAEADPDVAVLTDLTRYDPKLGLCLNDENADNFII